MPSVADAYYADGHLDTVGHDDDGNDIEYSKFSETYKQVIGGPMTFGVDHFDKGNFLSALKSLFGQGETTGTVSQSFPGEPSDGNNHNEFDGSDHDYDNDITVDDDDDDDDDDDMF